MLPCCVGWPVANRKCHTKRCLEFENNTASHMTFYEEANMSAGTTIYMLYPCICTICVNLLCN